uniref:Uncharacterized protein n=1 Tax=Anguilla anguilla TaxID=7936 RepID=A0A0E9PTS3_ANGAN
MPWGIPAEHQGSELIFISQLAHKEQLNLQLVSAQGNFKTL